MKKFILLFTAICLMSCSDDDGGTKTRTLYLEALTITNPGGGGGGALELVYNDEKKIKTIKGSGLTYNIKYKDGRLASIATPDDTTTFEFEYDENGILETVTQDGVDHDVTYDEDDREYTIPGLERGFTLNENNDIVSIKQGADDYDFAYDNDNKGSMHSMSSDIYLLAYFVNAHYLLSIHPATEFIGYTAENSFNSDGYIKKAILTIDGQEEPASIVYYSYTEL